MVQFAAKDLPDLRCSASRRHLAAWLDFFDPSWYSVLARGQLCVVARSLSLRRIHDSSPALDRWERNRRAGNPPHARIYHHFMGICADPRRGVPHPDSHIRVAEVPPEDLHDGVEGHSTSLFLFLLHPLGESLSAPCPW